MKKVYNALNLPDAHLILHLLRHQGIEAIVFNENACSVLGDIPVAASQPEVWVVDAAFATRANRLINTFCQRKVSGVVNICSQCGEQNPEEFEICWNCNLAFPA